MERVPSWPVLIGGASSFPHGAGFNRDSFSTSGPPRGALPYSKANISSLGGPRRKNGGPPPLLSLFARARRPPLQGNSPLPVLAPRSNREETLRPVGLRSPRGFSRNPSFLLRPAPGLYVSENLTEIVDLFSSISGPI